MEPRAYSNAPTGLNFLIAGYTHSDGGVATDPSLQLTNAKISTHGPLFGYVRSLGLGGKSAKLQVILPFSWLDGSADLAGAPMSREVSSLADPKVSLSVNVLGAPALPLASFRGYKQDLIVGVGLQVSAPLGQYDSDRLVNIGTNRWSFKPEVGVSKVLGRLSLDASAAATFYADNDEFFGGSTRTQDPLYAGQAHAIYNFPSQIWLALDATYYFGGESSVDGVPSDDRLGNSRVGITAAIPVDRSNSFKVAASHGVSARTGGDYDAIGVAWQYRWGGGS